MRIQRCPECGQSVEVWHNGENPIDDDGRADPWVFAVHKRRGERSGFVSRVECPGTGKTIASLKIRREMIRAGVADRIQERWKARGVS